MKKKLFRWLIALAVVLPCLLVTASAVTIRGTGACGTNLSWILYSDGELVISGTGAMFDYSSSGPWGDEITKVTFDGHITSIGSYAFYDHNNILEMIIPNSVVTIGKRAFDNCGSLNSVTIPNSVTSIGEGAFQYCRGLTSVSISDGVTSIGEYAFYSCRGLTSVSIPDSVTSIGANAFDLCPAIADFGQCGREVAYVLYSDGHLQITGTGEMSASSYGDYSVLGPLGAVEDVTSAHIADGVTTIASGAFRDCSALTSVSIPNGVTSIGNYAFAFCDSLTSVTIPDGVTSIGNSAFAGCAFETVTIPDSVTSIGSSAFYCSGLTSVTVPDSVNDIGFYIFEGCTNLERVELGRGLSVIEPGTFRSCPALKSINIPANVTEIGSSAFAGCTLLTTVTIANDMAEIGSEAFKDCVRLNRVEFLSDAPISVESNAFSGCNILTVYCHEGTVGWPTTGTWQGYPLVMLPAVVEYIITVRGAANGIVTVNKMVGMAGETVSVTATPTDDYKLVEILVDGVALEGNTFTISGNHTVTAVFEPIYTITGNGRTLSLEGEIYINQYILVTGFEGIDLTTKGGLLVWTSPVTEEAAVYGTQSYVNEGMVYNTTYSDGTPEYMVRTAGIAAKGYADELYFRAYVEVAEGEYIYGELTEYSVQSYCQNQLNKTSTSAVQKQLCAQLLHYGAAAQKRFNHNVTDLANANILGSYPAPEWMKG